MSFNSRTRVRYKSKKLLPKRSTALFQFPHAGKIQGQDIRPYRHYITRYGICQALFFLKTHYLYKKYIYAVFYSCGPPGKTPEKQRSSDRFAHACNKMPDIAHYVGFIGSIPVLSQNFLPPRLKARHCCRRHGSSCCEGSLCSHTRPLCA